MRKRAEAARPALDGWRTGMQIEALPVRDVGQRETKRLAGWLVLITPVLPASSSSPRRDWKGGLVDICNGRWKGLLVVVICSFAVLVAAAPERGRERRPPSGCRCAGTVVQVEECDMAPCCITTRTTALVDERGGVSPIHFGILMYRCRGVGVVVARRFASMLSRFANMGVGGGCR